MSTRRSVRGKAAERRIMRNRNSDGKRRIERDGRESSETCRGIVRDRNIGGEARGKTANEVDERWEVALGLGRNSRISLLIKGWDGYSRSLILNWVVQVGSNKYSSSSTRSTSGYHVRAGDGSEEEEKIKMWWNVEWVKATVLVALQRPDLLQRGVSRLSGRRSCRSILFQGPPQALVLCMAATVRGTSPIPAAAATRASGRELATSPFLK